MNFLLTMTLLVAQRVIFDNLYICFDEVIIWSKLERALAKLRFKLIIDKKG